MLNGRLLNTNAFVRYASHEGKKRFMRTVPASTRRSPATDFGRLKNHIPADLPHNNLPERSWAKHPLDSPQSQRTAQPLAYKSSRWAKHSLDTPPAAPSGGINSGSAIWNFEEVSILAPVRKSRTSRFKGSKTNASASPFDDAQDMMPSTKAQAVMVPSEDSLKEHNGHVAVEAINPTESSSEATISESKAKKPRRQLKPRKALITLTPNALENLRGLLDQPEPQLIRIGVKNRGCSGLTYNLEYVSEPGKFDEIVEQDGVKVVIDSKALFSIVGSEMDWIDDKLSSRFIFRNPNSKGTCGCGESFMV